MNNLQGPQRLRKIYMYMYMYMHTFSLSSLESTHVCMYNTHLLSLLSITVYQICIRDRCAHISPPVLEIGHYIRVV